MADKLTPKQEAFVRVYLKTGNASEAYRQAYDAKGMKPESINREAKALIDNPKISARLGVIQERAAEKAALSKSWVLERLMRNARIAMAEETVTIKKAVKDKATGMTTTVEIEVTDRDTPGANRALELLGKEIGMFVDRAEVGGPGDFDQMSDDELREFVTQRASASRQGGEGIGTPRGGRKARSQLN